MGLNLNLFVHGVPKGQKIWGPQEDDRIYIESFYGRKANVEVQLIVDIIQTSGNVNSYYTYFRNGNILDNDSRAGSYFALTVRVNAYYTDVSNMYNILDAAYHKFVLGTILKSDASVTKFIVQDFDQVSRQLQNIDKEIIEYLSLFSIDSDIVGLNGFMVNAKSETVNVNLLECNSKSIFTHVKSYGNLSVSPLHPTMQVLELTRKKNDEIENIKSLAQQQTFDVKEKSEQAIQAVTKKAEDMIKAIKTEYASIDKKIDALEKQLKTEKNKSAELDGKLTTYNNKLRDYEVIKQRLDSKEKDLNSANQFIYDIKQSFSKLSGLAESIDVNINQTQVVGAKKTKWKNKLNKFHSMIPLINLVITLILMLVLVFTLTKSAHAPSNKDFGIANKKIEQLQNDLYKTNTQLKESQKQLKNAQNQINKPVIESTDKSKVSETNAKTNEYPDARIDIREFNKNKTKMSMNETCHIKIENVNSKDGVWKTKDFMIKGDAITPNKSGNCKIDYVINGIIIKSRIIEVDK